MSWPGHRCGTSPRRTCCVICDCLCVFAHWMWINTPPVLSKLCIVWRLDLSSVVQPEVLYNFMTTTRNVQFYDYNSQRLKDPGQVYNFVPCVCVSVCVVNKYPTLGVLAGLPGKNTPGMWRSRDGHVNADPPGADLLKVWQVPNQYKRHQDQSLVIVCSLDAQLCSMIISISMSVSI